MFGIASLFGGSRRPRPRCSRRGCCRAWVRRGPPTALSLITTTFPAGLPRNRAFAVYAAMSGAGAAIGLILGGVLTEYPGAGRSSSTCRSASGAVPRPDSSASPSASRAGFDLPGAITGDDRPRQPRLRPHPRGVAGSWSNPDDRHVLGAGPGADRGLPGDRAEDDAPALPFRVLASNRTRAVSVRGRCSSSVRRCSRCSTSWGCSSRQVLGYRRSLKAGLAFLPFSFGIVGGAARVRPGGPGRPALDRQRRRSSPRWGCSCCPGERGSQYFLGPHRADARDLDWDGPGLRAADAHRRRRRPQGGHRARRPPCSTRCSRSAAPSASPPSAPWRSTARPRTSPSTWRRRAGQVTQALYNASFTHGATQAMVVSAAIVLAGGGADLQPADDQPHRPGQRLGLPARGRHGLEVTD